MITEKDLQEAIAECQGVRNPNANTAIKLAAFLTIQRELFEKSEQLATTQDFRAVAPAYSYAAPPELPEAYSRQNGETAVGNYGDSDFLRAVAGKDPARMWEIMDELMEDLKMLNERVYNGVMRRIR